MSRWSSIKEFLLRQRTLVVVYILLSLVTTAQLLSLGTYEFKADERAAKSKDIVNNAATVQLYVGHHYTFYNNYVIFRQSFTHLVAGKDLYAMYPDEQWDLYKYTPTFALFMAPFAHMPDWLGFGIWTLINALVLLGAVYMLPYPKRTNGLILWLVLVELLTSLQNAQSNALLAGLMIAAYACMERGKMLWATLWLVMAAYIKVYGLFGIFLFLLYPNKIKAALYMLLWMVVFAVLPLIVISYTALVAQYQSWGRMLGADQATSYGLSVVGWLHAWFGVDGVKNIVALAGGALLVLPYLRWRMYKEETYRLLQLAAVMVWVVIFNHKAESPTFIIALASAGIWFFAHPATPVRKLLLWVVFVGSSLTVTDIFPPMVKEHFLIPYVIKAVPCILLWIVMVIELMTLKRNATVTDIIK